ncbi:ABC transporter family substrate-binding protein [Streptomyces sp. NPDC051940]|uniref:ABC transporter family substrate-binding protein n=1 Tax=Streptomyces sp. NPDC051940 TaxID=3155675 RepID=UPI00341DD907
MVMSRPYRLPAAVLAAGLLLPLAGCSADDASSTRAAQDVAVASRQELRSGGTVRWAVDSAPQTFNVFQADASEATERVAGAVLPSLFTLDRRGRPQVNTDYLLSAKVVDEAPRQVVVYTLNPKAKWSDGQPLSVEDFQAQWQALNGKDGAFWTARNAGYDRIRSVSPGKKPGEVRVVFADRYADWEALFTPLYPQSVMSSPEEFNTTSRTRLDVTAGPFAVQGAQDGKGAKAAAKPKVGGPVTLVRNTAWWGRTALLDSIVFTEVARDKRQAAMRAGTVDIAEVDRELALDLAQRRAAADAAKGAGGAGGADGKNTDDKPPAGQAEPGKAGYGQGRAGAPNQHVDEVQVSVDQMRRADEEAAAEEDAASGDDAKPGAAAPAGRTPAELDPARAYTLHRALEPAYTQLALNGSDGPLADEQVRRAVARAIDRRVIARSVLAPLGLPAAPLGSHLLMEAQEGYADQSPALGRQDIQAAQALIAEAGWKGGPVGRPGGTEAKGDDSKALFVRTSLFTGVPMSVRPVIGVQYGTLVVQAKLARVAEESGKDSEEYAKARKQARAQIAKLVHASTPLAEAVANPVQRPFVKDGKPLTLRFVVPSDPGSGQLRQVAARIVRMLDSIGVRTQVVETEGESYFRDYIASGDYDLALYSWPGTAYPATDARPIYAKPVPAADGSLMVEQNYTRVGTDEIDRLFDKAASELNGRMARELLARADARIWASAGSVPLYQRPELVAVRNGLANAGAFGFATPHYEDMGYRR